MSLTRRVGAALAPKVAHLAPGVTGAFVLEALDKAIAGVGPLPGAAAAAEKQLAEQDGDVERAIHEVIENNVRLAGAQGFLTNVGGLVAVAVTVPANISGLALLQARMVAGIAHLRGYDLDDARVRNAILIGLLGEDRVTALVKQQRLPGTPMAVATAPVADPALGQRVAAEVASELLGRIAGKRMVTVVGRRVPVVGGVVGAGTDGYATWRVGRYVDRELLPRAHR